MKNSNQFIRDKIYSLRPLVPQRCLNKHLIMYPEFINKYSEHQRTHYLQDVDYHLIYLAEAISTNHPELFFEYLKWCKTFFYSIGILNEHIVINLEILRETLISLLPDEAQEIIDFYIRNGIKIFNSYDPLIPSYIQPDNKSHQIATEYLNYLLNNDRKSALSLILDYYQREKNLKEIYLNVFQVVQNEVGRLWQMNQITVAQEHYITAATQLIMSHLYPYLFEGSRKDKSIVVLCVNGELHELGARMVADFFEMEGWNSYYLGANTPVLSVLKMLKDVNAQALAISVTMTYNISNVRNLISNVKRQLSDYKIKILVGGYPFNLVNDLWKEIGADAYGRNADEAVQTLNSLIN